MRQKKILQEEPGSVRPAEKTIQVIQGHVDVVAVNHRNPVIAVTYCYKADIIYGSEGYSYIDDNERDGGTIWIIMMTDSRG